MAGSAIEPLLKAVAAEDDPSAVARLLGALTSVLRQQTQHIDDGVQLQIGSSVARCLASMRASSEVRHGKGRWMHARGQTAA